jgi:hypothetical protein
MEKELSIPYAKNEIAPEVLADEAMHTRLEQLCSRGRFQLRRDARAAGIELTPELKAPGSHKLFVAVLFEKEFGTCPFVDGATAQAAADETPELPDKPAALPEAQPEPTQEAAPMSTPEATTAKPKAAKRQGSKRQQTKAKPAPAKKKQAAKTNGKAAPAVPAKTASRPAPAPAPVPLRNVAYDDGDDTPTNEPAFRPLGPAPQDIEPPPPVDTSGIEQKLGELTMHVEHLTQQLNALQDTFITLSTVTSILLPTIQTGFHRLGKEFGAHVSKDLVKRFDKVEQSVTAEMEATPEKEPG